MSGKSRRLSGRFAIDMTRSPHDQLRRLPNASRKTDPFRVGDLALKADGVTVMIVTSTPDGLRWKPHAAKKRGPPPPLPPFTLPKRGPPPLPRFPAIDPSTTRFFRVCKKNGLWHVVDRDTNRTAHFPRRPDALMIFQSKQNATRVVAGINRRIRRSQGRPEPRRMTTRNAPPQIKRLIPRMIRPPPGKSQLPPAQNLALKTLGVRSGGTIAIVRRKCVDNPSDFRNQKVKQVWSTKSL